MAWQQLHDADMNVGYTGGWCLKYVQDAFGTDHPYPTALDAWNANVGGGNHAGELPPLGITVPVYLSLGNVPAGHVAIRLSDGWVASSTQPGDHPTPYYHKSLDDLLAVYGQYNGGATYLGWSEYVGTQQVVTYQPDVVYATDDEINQAYQDILGRTADDGGMAHYRNYTIDFVRQDLLNSTEYKEHQAALQAAANPVIAPIHNPVDTTVPAPVEPPAPVVTPEPTPQPVIEPSPVEVPLVPTPEPTPLPTIKEPDTESIFDIAPQEEHVTTPKSIWAVLIGFILKLLRIRK